MIWRAGQLLLVRRGETFLLLDATGAITKRFEPRQWSYEDDLGETSYVVVDEQLRRREFVQGWGGRTRSEDELVLDALVPAPDPESARFVETALGDAAVVEEEQRILAAQRAEARVRAIEGARDDLRRGPAVAAAQNALVRHVYQHADELAAKLLHALLVLARAGVDDRVIERFARGCRWACFERPPELATEDVPDMAGPPALVDLVTSLAAELDAESDYKDWIDARGAASSYAAAAHDVRRAAELLAGR